MIILTELFLMHIDHTHLLFFEFLFLSYSSNCNIKHNNYSTIMEYKVREILHNKVASNNSSRLRIIKEMVIFIFHLLSASFGNDQACSDHIHENISSHNIVNPSFLSLFSIFCIENLQYFSL